MEMARCLMFEKNLPKQFWAKAAHTAVFLLNRLPTKAVTDKTPYEAWYGFKHSLKNLKIFGCLCFVYVPQIKMDKLDKKVEVGIFVGYSTISKAYRIFQPNTKKILISRDMHFMENDECDWKEKQTAFVPDKVPKLQLRGDELIDDTPIRGIGSLSEIYERCNVAMFEPKNFWDAEKDPKWIATMEKEMSMIKKKKTWQLVKRPTDRKVIGVK